MSPAMTTKSCDVVVIGAGVVGLATAYNLAKRNVATVLLEQYPLPHTRGSSHGQSRIIRRAYSKTWYSQMMPAAYASWQHLEEEEDVELYKKTGLLCLADKQMKNHITETGDALDHAKVPYETLDNEGIRARFPQFDLTDGYTALHENDGGILRADKALIALQNQFKKRGGELHDGVKVMNIEMNEPGPSLVTLTAVRADGKTIKYMARKIILCAGPWTNDLLKHTKLQLPLKPQRVTVTYWQESEGHHSSNDGMPCFIVYNRNGHLYGLPSEEYPRQVKVAVHEGPVIHPDTRDLNPELDNHIIDGVKQFVRAHLPKLGSEPVVLEKCIYTMTPDEDYVIDRHPECSSIIIGAGFSGHGFKLSPVVGGLLADLALGVKPTFDLTPFSLNRFNKSSRL